MSFCMCYFQLEPTMLESHQLQYPTVDERNPAAVGRWVSHCNPTIYSSLIDTNSCQLVQDCFHHSCLHHSRLKRAFSVVPNPCKHPLISAGYIQGCQLPQTDPLMPELFLREEHADSNKQEIIHKPIEMGGLVVHFDC